MVEVNLQFEGGFLEGLSSHPLRTGCCFTPEI